MDSQTEKEPGTPTIRQEAARFVGHSALMIPFRAWSMILQFLLSFFLARVLDAAGYGRWGLMLALAQWGYTFFLCWNTFSLSRYGREEHLSTGSLAATFTSRTVMLIPSLLLLLVIAAIGHGGFARYIHSPRWVIALVVLYAIALVIADTVQYIMPAIARSDLSSVVMALDRTAALGFIAGFHALDCLNPVTTLISFIASSLLVNLPALFTLRRLFLPLRLDRENLRRCWIFCRPIILISPAGGIIGWMDPFIINHYSTIENVGRYFLTYQFYTAVTQLSFIIMHASQPLTVLIVLQKRRDLVDLFANGVQRLAGIGAAAAALAATPLVWLIIAYVGKDGAPLMREVWLLLLPGCIASFMTAPLSSFYQAHEDTITLGWTGISSMLVKVALAFLLVHKLGPHGAAIATSVAAIYLYGTQCWRLRKFDVISRGILVRSVFFLLPSLLLWRLPGEGSLPTGIAVFLLAALLGGIAAAQTMTIMKVQRRA